VIRAIIFDMNGVLVDDEHVHFELFRETLRDLLAIELTEQAYYEKYLGFDDRGCFEAAVRDAGRALHSSQLEQLIRHKAELYLTRAAAGLRLFPGAGDSIRALAERWPVAINSGALRAEIELVLKLLAVRELIAAIVAAEDTERGKPDPEGYLLTLDALRSHVGEDLEAGHCLVIEDSYAGIQAAKAAGMWAVGVTHTYPEAELRHAGADAVLHSLERLDPSAVLALFTPEISP
jgi:HAD superfamily hydrolase (TIGR01509 family)